MSHDTAPPQTQAAELVRNRPGRAAPSPADDHQDKGAVPLRLERFTPYLMNRITARYNRAVEEELRDTGVSVIQMRVLAVLIEHGPQSVNNLSVLTVIKQSTLSRALDQMEAAGLIRRRIDDADSRIRIIHAASAGRELHRCVWPEMERMQAAMLKDLSSDEQRLLNHLLTRVLQTIRHHDF